MAAATLLERLAESRKLPLGHYDRVLAKEAVDREYADCHKQEAEWYRKIPRMFRVLRTREQVLSLAWHLCNDSGITQIRLMHFASKECKSFVSAHYNPRTKSVHFAHDVPMQITLVVHEVCHHVSIEESRYYGHGERFCWNERYLFGIAETWVRRQRGMVRFFAPD